MTVEQDTYIFKYVGWLTLERDNLSNLTPGFVYILD